MLPPRTSRDERVFAALAHLSIFANGFTLLGIAGAVLIWATQRRSSHFVARHALQAIGYQVMALIVTMVLATAWGLSLLLTLLPVVLRPELYAGELPGTFGVVLFGGLLLLLLFVVLVFSYGIWGALTAWRGEYVQYVMIGGLVEPGRSPPPNRRRTTDNEDFAAVQPPVPTVKPPPATGMPPAGRVRKQAAAPVADNDDAPAAADAEPSPRVATAAAHTAVAEVGDDAPQPKQTTVLPTVAPYADDTPADNAAASGLPPTSDGETEPPVKQEATGSEQADAVPPVKQEATG